MSEGEAKIAAATLILLRDMPDGPPQTLLIERGKHLSFAGGNMVFPGGRADADDRSVAERADLLIAGPEIDIDDMVGRVAAIRETLEEVGLAPGIETIESVDQLAEIRAQLHGGTLFSEILTEHGLRIDPYRLTPFARWIPRTNRISNYDTRFYVAREPAIGEALVDGHESASLCWMTAAEHVAAGNLVYPTQRNLEKLAQAASMDDTLALCERYPVRIISPWIEQRDGTDWLCIPTDLGYPVTAALPSWASRGFPDPLKPAMTRDPE